MPRRHNRTSTKARHMALNKIAERCGVPVAQPKPIIIARLPPPDEGIEPKGGEIRTRRRVWGDMSPGRMVAVHDGRGE